jgi:hypothetical protein
MHRPARADPSPAAPLDRRTFVARAKRTDRTAARRRYRAELTGQDDATGVETAENAPTRSRGAQPGSAQPRPGIMASFRKAYHPLDLRGDLRAAPSVLVHWGVLVTIGLTVLAAAFFVVSYSPGVSDIAIGDTEAMKTLVAGNQLPYTIVGLALLSPPPAIGAFLIGFTAKRASWLGGLVYGLVVTIASVAMVATPAGRLLTQDQPSDSFIVQMASIAPMGAALFAAAAAWYRRFLDLANPNRGQRRPVKPQPGRGNPRQKDRPLVSRAAARRR